MAAAAGKRHDAKSQLTIQFGERFALGERFSSNWLTHRIQYRLMESFEKSLPNMHNKCQATIRAEAP